MTPTPGSQTAATWCHSPYGTYKPLGRPLFIYVNNASYTDKSQVKAFVDFYVENSLEIADLALFVPLTDDQITTAQEELASLG